MSNIEAGGELWQFHYRDIFQTIKIIFLLYVCQRVPPHCRLLRTRGEMYSPCGPNRLLSPSTKGRGRSATEKRSLIGWGVWAHWPVRRRKVWRHRPRVKPCVL